MGPFCMPPEENPSNTAVLDPPASTTDTPFPSNKPDTSGEEEEAPVQDTGAKPASIVPDLATVLNKQRRIDAGEDGEDLKLSAGELRLYNQHVQSENDRARNLADADASYQKWVAGVGERFGAARGRIEEAVNEAFTEAGVELSVSQAKLISKTILEEHTNLEGGIAETITIPILSLERERLRGEIVRNGLATAAQAREWVMGADLVRNGRQPSLAELAFWVGEQKGQKIGPGPDMRTTKASEWEQVEGEWLHKPSVKKGENNIRPSQKGTVGGGSSRAGSVPEYHTKMQARDLHARGLLSNDQMRAINRDERIPEM